MTSVIIICVTAIILCGIICYASYKADVKQIERVYKRKLGDIDEELAKLQMDVAGIKIEHAYLNEAVKHIKGGNFQNDTYFNILTKEQMQKELGVIFAEPAITLIGINEKLRTLLELIAVYAHSEVMFDPEEDCGPNTAAAERIKDIVDKYGISI